VYNQLYFRKEEVMRIICLAVIFLLFSHSVCSGKDKKPTKDADMDKVVRLVKRFDSPGPYRLEAIERIVGSPMPNKGGPIYFAESLKNELATSAMAYAVHDKVQILDLVIKPETKLTTDKLKAKYGQWKDDYTVPRSRATPWGPARMYRYKRPWGHIGFEFDQAELLPRRVVFWWIAPRAHK